MTIDETMREFDKKFPERIYEPNIKSVEVKSFLRKALEEQEKKHHQVLHTATKGYIDKYEDLIEGIKDSHKRALLEARVITHKEYTNPNLSHLDSNYAIRQIAELKKEKEGRDERYGIT